MSQQWTIGRVLQWASDDFAKRGIASPRLDAELLLAHCLGCSRIQLYTQFDKPLAADELAAFRALIQRRRNGECCAHLTGYKEFWSLSFAVTHDVLVPRPDTETLVQAILDTNLRSGSLLDLGTGSGCIALTVATERPGLEITATDISEAALRVAQDNARRLGVEATFLLGDLFAALPPDSRFDIIASNPPYLSDEDMDALSPEVAREPRRALWGGPDGLDVVRRILADAPTHLKTGGWVFLEVAPDQAQVVAEELGPTALGVRGAVRRDLAGRPRVVLFHP